MEEFFLIVDTRKSRAAQKLVAHDFAPQGLHFLVLGEKAVPPHIEVVALVLVGAGDAADFVVLFQHQRSHSLLGRFQRSRQPGWTTADDDHAVRFSALRIQNWTPEGLMTRNWQAARYGLMARAKKSRRTNRYSGKTQSSRDPNYFGQL